MSTATKPVNRLAFGCFVYHMLTHGPHLLALASRAVRAGILVTHAIGGYYGA